MCSVLRINPHIKIIEDDTSFMRYGLKHFANLYGIKIYEDVNKSDNIISTVVQMSGDDTFEEMLQDWDFDNKDYKRFFSYIFYAPNDPLLCN